MYDQIAHYYDLTHADLTDDIDFILSLAQAVNGPILELGCGSGRLLLPLARAGFTVTGVDNSAAMLARARAALQKESPDVQNRVMLLHADMSQMKLGDGRFALAIIPYNTFMHLDSAQKTAALKRVKQNLGENGRLFIDLINPFAIADTLDDQDLILENSFTDPQTGQIIQQLASNLLNEDIQCLQITWVYDVSPLGEPPLGEPPLGGGPVQRTTAQTDYHYLFPHQIDLLLQETGFRLTDLSGDYDGSIFDEDSERLLVTASPIP